MKKHAIIPIFIPHKGCPHDCIFCNQRKITAHSGAVTVSDVHKTVAQYMSTLSSMNLETIELSFFGGSFTGIPMEEQKAFLSAAKEYKDKGVIQKIHLSTRPDYINKEILDNLKFYGADVIELGVQSFAEPVLKASNRGHNTSCVYESCALIKEYGFTLGIQLMIGLPGDTAEYDLFSAMETVKIKPEIARLYPTVVIKDTGLYKLMENGLYTPLSEKESVERTASMYKILTEAGINVIRVGLKSSDIMSDASNTANTFHPAFRQLVEGLIARQELEKQTDALLAAADKPPHEPARIALISNEKCKNMLFGHKGENKIYFRDKYKETDFTYLTDVQAGLELADGEYRAVSLAHISNTSNKKI